MYVNCIITVILNWFPGVLNYL